MRVPQQLAAMRSIMHARRSAPPEPSVAEKIDIPKLRGVLAAWRGLRFKTFATPSGEPALDPPQPGATNGAGFPFVARIRFQGLPQIDVEQRRSDVRRGDGWSVIMPYHYGEIRGTEGVDGDPIDVCVGPDAYAPRAYIVRQKEPGQSLDDSYDEDKVMVGFSRKSDAVEAYRRAYDKPGFIGEVITMTIGELQAWLEKASNRGKKIVAHRVEADGAKEATKALQPECLLEDATTSSVDDCQDCGWSPCRCEGAKSLPEYLRWQA